MKRVAISRITGDVYNIVVVTVGMIGLQKADEKPLYISYDDTDFMVLLNVSDALVNMAVAAINAILSAV